MHRKCFSLSFQIGIGHYVLRLGESTNDFCINPQKPSGLVWRSNKTPSGKKNPGFLLQTFEKRLGKHDLLRLGSSITFISMYFHKDEQGFSALLSPLWWKSSFQHCLNVYLVFSICFKTNHVQIHQSTSQHFLLKTAEHSLKNYT